MAIMQGGVGVPADFACGWCFELPFSRFLKSTNNTELNDELNVCRNEEREVGLMWSVVTQHLLMFLSGDKTRRIFCQAKVRL